MRGRSGETGRAPSVIDMSSVALLEALSAAATHARLAKTTRSQDTRFQQPAMRVGRPAVSGVDSRGHNCSRRIEAWHIVVQHAVTAANKSRVLAVRPTQAVVVGRCFASATAERGPLQTASGPHGVEAERLNDAPPLLLARSPPRPWLKGTCASSPSPPRAAAHRYPGRLRTARASSDLHDKRPA